MDTNEKFSDLLQIMCDKIPVEYNKNESVLCFMVRVIQFVETDSYLSSILTFENIDVLMEQFLFVKIKNIEKIRHVLRDAMYLMKCNLLFQNLKQQRKKKNCFCL